jgi:hypothetical protein
MKSVCFAAALALLTAGCTSTSSPANDLSVPPGTPGTNSYTLSMPNGAMPTDAGSRPPRLTVGTSYSDTQLILPWFLNDVINFVNYR